MFNKLKEYAVKPEPYASSTHKFWDDEYISSQMLPFHLDPDCEPASRKHSFIDQSAAWIASLLPAQAKLLDLGCGPGLYTQRFARAGMDVTGIDLSARSLQYATQSALKEEMSVRYLQMNNLDLDYHGQFDAITLIYCDYAVFSKENRQTLLVKIKEALKPGGLFIMDVFTEKNPRAKEEKTSWTFKPSGGFWSPDPHICLDAFYTYPENVFCSQTLVITEDDVRCYNIWDTVFSADSITKEAMGAGFKSSKLYDDVSGKPHTGDSKTLCIVLKK